ncbi:uncharacterized protein B0I36DRAFT_364498 [Microdochium trichocladiopsis]|uniref:RNase H type-1 domain-containing protein n=1 Tax=Microdochium trichocladiopsis TaxID=1682393 RepID=A0A9P8Y2I2_9PEZI|nr:uncharacterized protein B0I36DRAFT_364498 [Microdochium trichocladiopsis]KAH7027269.1 hypothetical protein B0I36DRAFT_364498 [Microdochium trichocladiopsis]
MANPERLLFRVYGMVQTLGRPGVDGALGCCAATIGNNLEEGEYEAVELTIGERPTYDRAEIIAVSIALQWALRIIGEADTPRGAKKRDDNDVNKKRDFEITIYTDSRYAIMAMNYWMPHWMKDGKFVPRNSNHTPVRNKDLFQDIADIRDEILKLANVTFMYEQVPRAEVQKAYEICYGNLDEQMKDQELGKPRVYSGADTSLIDGDSGMNRS